MPRIGRRSSMQNDPKAHYNYCCVKHDPGIPSVNLDHLGEFGLRRTRANSVVKIYDHMDPYTRKAIEMDDIQDIDQYELDHIWEKQLAGDVAAKLEEEDRDDIVKVLREDVVNKNWNLCLTMKQVNQLKGKGVFSFLDDRATGHQECSFTEYLSKEYDVSTGSTGSVKKLPRSVSGRICGEMWKSARRAMSWFADEGDSPVHNTMAKGIQELIVAMDL
ncbi:hypothetical protein HDU93_007441 [Gonapodya sp. JEL0774]|nr:hypothetical protein HDU93_007441 [Gonapodya sp. JEL0774]